MAELADAHGSGPCGSNTMRVQVPFSALIRIRTEASSPCPYSIGSRMLLNPRVHGLIRLAPDSVGAKHAPPEHSTPFSALSVCMYLTTAVNMAEMLINTNFFIPHIVRLHSNICIKNHHFWNKKLSKMWSVYEGLEGVGMRKMWSKRRTNVLLAYCTISWADERTLRFDL